MFSLSDSSLSRIFRGSFISIRSRSIVPICFDSFFILFSVTFIEKSEFKNANILSNSFVKQREPTSRLAARHRLNSRTSINENHLPEFVNPKWCDNAVSYVNKRNEEKISNWIDSISRFLIRSRTTLTWLFPTDNPFAHCCGFTYLFIVFFNHPVSVFRNLLASVQFSKVNQKRSVLLKFE